ncbi:MAG: molybdopterin-dependent oxidoreductase [Candidatus Eisenbacteria bacterium]
MKHTLLVMIALVCLLPTCSPRRQARVDYPDFITANDEYYITRIGNVPEVVEEDYELTIRGHVAVARSLTLDELRSLEMVEIPLTVECIGNYSKGPLLSTAVWKGFRLQDLLDSMSLDENATGVVYRSADGYYASHTLQQIRDNGVIGALYMNGEVIPPEHGFPLRFVNPGYYGVKQPGWVTELEVLDRPIKDYWEDRGWDCSPPMGVDATIFFPGDGVTIKTGTSLEMGGAAFGGTRITKVEITTNSGATWQDAEIVRSLDADNVWVFWKARTVFPTPGEFKVNVRATDIHGNQQQEDDPDRYNGTNDWPVLSVKVRD